MRMMHLFRLHDIIQSAKTKNIPHAIIIRKDVFGKYKLQKEFGCNYPLSREDALQIVVDYLPENSVVVSTTGKGFLVSYLNIEK